MKIQKQFIEFLKREGVFDKYVTNWKCHELNWNFKNRIKNRLDYMDNAFDYQFTPEGFVFWRGINIKWQKYLTADKDPALHNTRCGYCGRFVKKEFWLIKGDPCVAICLKCIDKIPVEWR